MRAALTLTNEAILQIKILLTKRQKPSLGIRVGIKAGGCSGYTYAIEYADHKNQYDEEINTGGITLFIDPKALMYLIGTEMDYTTTDFKSGFVFNNPNSKGDCGCGKSFSA